MIRSILLVSNLFAPTPGSWGVCRELAAQLRMVGWQVFTTSAWPWRRIRPVEMLWSIWYLRNRFNVAHVDVFSGPAFRWAEASVWLLKRLGKPTVITLHGGNLPDFAQAHEKRVRRLLNTADYVTTPSSYLLAHMRRFRPDILSIPNPIFLDAYNYRLRTSLQPNLVWLRAFHEMYNPIMAVDVVDTLRTAFPSIKLTMIGRDKGDGSLEATRSLIVARGLEAHIEIVGSVPKDMVSNWLDKGDVFINTTNIDNAPISVLEALAAGLCVVSTNAGGIPYLLNDGNDALLVPSADVLGMANAIASLLRDASLAERLSRTALETSKRYDWQTVLPQWKALLTGAIEKSVD